MHTVSQWDSSGSWEVVIHVRVALVNLVVNTEQHMAFTEDSASRWDVLLCWLTLICRLLVLVHLILGVWRAACCSSPAPACSAHFRLLLRAADVPATLPGEYRAIETAVVFRWGPGTRAPATRRPVQAQSMAMGRALPRSRRVRYVWWHDCNVWSRRGPTRVVRRSSGCGTGTP